MPFSGPILLSRPKLRRRMWSVFSFSFVSITLYLFWLPLGMWEGDKKKKATILLNGTHCFGSLMACPFMPLQTEMMVCLWAQEWLPQRPYQSSHMVIHFLAGLLNTPLHSYSGEHIHIHIIFSWPVRYHHHPVFSAIRSWPTENSLILVECTQCVNSPTALSPHLTVGLFQTTSRL